MTVSYSDKAAVEWDDKKVCWVMLRPFTVTWTDGWNKVLVHFTVPVGFEHDGPSIPRRLQGIVSKYGNQFQPSIAHDYTYVHDTGLTRKQADQLFLQAMKDKNVPWYRRSVMWAAVRMGGKGRWR